jgi:hypothetical protein
MASVVRVHLRCSDRAVELDSNDLGLLEAMVQARFDDQATVTFPSGFKVNAAEMKELQQGMRQVLGIDQKDE